MYFPLTTIVKWEKAAIYFLTYIYSIKNELNKIITVQALLQVQIDLVTRIIASITRIFTKLRSISKINSSTSKQASGYSHITWCAKQESSQVVTFILPGMQHRQTSKWQYSYYLACSTSKQPSGSSHITWCVAYTNRQVDTVILPGMWMPHKHCE